MAHLPQTGVTHPTAEELAWGTPSTLHQPPLDDTLSLDFDLSLFDPAFPPALKNYRIAYSLHLPHQPSTEPVLLLCHPFNNSRNYWEPQLHDPLLAPYPLLTFDAIGFSSSALAGAPWSFDLAAALVLAVLDRLSGPGQPLEGRKAVLVGDSMGGGPTGLRVLLRGEGKVKGVVVVGSAAEEESEDFVEEYTAAAASFAEQALDPSVGPLAAIARLAHNMAQDGYTPSLAYPFSMSRAFGEGVIRKSLERTLVDSEGVLEGGAAGRAMVVNFGCLNHRRSLVEELSTRPSPLGEGQVLVMHGTLDKAYPFERSYHTRTVSAVGPDNAELYVVEGGPHFVTVTHWQQVDRAIVEWIKRKCL